MNIFALDDSPIKSAQMHCDAHVIKMILESAQIMSTVHRVTNAPFCDELYRETHANHPSCIWARKCSSNYEWLYVLFKTLSDIYTARSGKVHKSYADLGDKLAFTPPALPRKPRTPFAVAMPDKYKVIGRPVQSYRNYYCHEKARFAKFTYNPTPDWFSNEYVPPFKRDGGYKATGRLARLIKQKENA